MKKFKLNYVIFPIVIMLSAIFMVVMMNKDSQAIPAIQNKITFQGNYKIANGKWKKLSSNEYIPSDKGDVTLRGYFQLEAFDGTVIGKAPKNMHMIAYYDHIGGQINVNGQPAWIFDMENKMLGKGSCGTSWVPFDNPSEEGQEIEIILTNPHKYGNKDSFNEFLNSISAYNSTSFNENMYGQGSPKRNIGFIIFIISFIIIGIAVFSLILKVPHTKMLWIFGFMILFSGGFIILDSPNYCFSGNSTIFITSAQNICIIMYPLFMYSLITNFLNDKIKKIGGTITGLYGLFSAVIIIYAIFGNALIYDLNYYTLIVQFAVSIILTILLAACFKGSTKKLIAIRTLCIVSLLSLAIDIFAVNKGFWNKPIISEIVFIIIFVSAIIYSLKIIPSNIKSSIHEKELELELQEDKVSIMVSQIQPHFLNNALSAICNLCEENPIQARDTLVDFSDYLRENVDSLNSNNPVFFTNELSHIKTYLKLEKLRFKEKLNVIYDIRTENFEIQPLTIQPIVENAVKHGICKKEENGTITIKTREENEIIIISVIDDGIGFDTNCINYYDDSHSHVGLKNVKLRVENLPEGKFTIESEKGKGTTVTISFRK